MRRVCAITLALWGPIALYGLDPHKSLTQYSRTVWTQQHGLPQDTVRAIAQTDDGYLWLGTDEGLARFDGYDFVRYSREDGQLPSNSITTLGAAPGGILWIGTTGGLVRYDGRTFVTFTTKDGMPHNSVAALAPGEKGDVWIDAGGSLSHFDGRHFENIPTSELHLDTVRTLTQDDRHTLFVGGTDAVSRLENGKFVRVLGPPVSPPGVMTSALHADRSGTLWMLGVRSMVSRSASGVVHVYTKKDGVADGIGQGKVLEDREGNIWVGTANRLARFENGKFNARALTEDAEPDSVRSMFEDREGNLWVGSNSGLTRFRDDVFTMYGKAEGFPSDEPNTVYQDRAGRVWIGFLDGGVMQFSEQSKTFRDAPGTPKNRIFAFHETRAGELLICSGAGLTFLKDGRSHMFVPTDDPWHRKYVYDALEGPDGTLWLALPNGLGRLRGKEFHTVIPGGPLLDDAVASLALAPDGGIWAASHRGLWYVKGEQTRHYTTADGLANDEIHSLYQEPGGTLWVGTFGGGLSAFRDGKFSNFAAKDGLLSDNIANIIDDGESLWLTTTRGICRVLKSQLLDFSAHHVTVLAVSNYGIADGLRSMQYSATAGAGGGRHRDGSIWFVTSRGIAVYPNQARTRSRMAPEVHLVEMSTEAQQLDWTHDPQIEAGSGRLQFRYTAIHLSAPERVQYSYKLDGLDQNWVNAKNRRGVNYSSLGHGNYLFRVRADLPGGESSETAFAFTLLPHFYETTWFRAVTAVALAALVWMGYRLKERQVRSRFALVLEERARIAREVHDTLAQGFVGISSQLQVVEMSMPADAEEARASLKLARGMARHSLTEARRSVSDLRSAALEDQDLAAALRSSAEQWTAGSGVDLKVDIEGETGTLRESVAHNLLRIAQEAVTNALKHAHADRITLRLSSEPKIIKLNIKDDGCGFEQQRDFTADGHFGLMGMRERVEQVGGEFRLKSQPGEGTELEVSVPL